ncbi:MAG: hypothetical protein O3A01_02925 [bacterium]|nr:hypothetical protein [bacterium]
MATNFRPMDGAKTSGPALTPRNSTSATPSLGSINADALYVAIKDMPNGRVSEIINFACDNGMTLFEVRTALRSIHDSKVHKTAGGFDKTVAAFMTDEATYGQLLDPCKLVAGGQERGIGIVMKSIDQDPQIPGNEKPGQKAQVVAIYLQDHPDRTSSVIQELESLQKAGAKGLGKLIGELKASLPPHVASAPPFPIGTAASTFTPDMIRSATFAPKDRGGSLTFTRTYAQDIGSQIMGENPKTDLYLCIAGNPNRPGGAANVRNAFKPVEGRLGQEESLIMSNADASGNAQSPLLTALVALGPLSKGVPDSYEHAAVVPGCFISSRARRHSI